MLELLHEVENKLPELLEYEERWNSLFVDYEKPFVERLWTPYKENRVYLHKIYPCNSGESLYHPHPWPSAMRILNGKYEMGVGDEIYGVPVDFAVIVMGEGTEYEMTHRHAYHYVRPLDGPTYSLMVTGKPWDMVYRTTINKPLGPLSEEQKRDIFDFFKGYYKGGKNG